MLKCSLQYLLLMPVLFSNPGYILAEQQAFGLEEKLGVLLSPDVYVLSEDSVPVLLNAMITKPTLLVFVYYNCTHECPEMMEGISELVNFARVNPGRDYQIITISIDHAEPASLARSAKQKYTQRIRKPVDPYFWQFFTADSLTIRKLTNGTGWKFRHIGSGFIHPTASILITPEKKISQYFYGTYFNYMHFDFSVNQAAQELTEPTRIKNMRYCTNEAVLRSHMLRSLILIVGITLIAVITTLFLFLTLSERSPKTMENQEK
jgi:protein SCO1